MTLGFALVGRDGCWSARWAMGHGWHRWIEVVIAPDLALRRDEVNG